MKDYRNVPLAVLRDYARSQAEITSIRHVAEEVGIGRSTVNKFILSRTDHPQPRIRRLLALWYLRTIETADAINLARPYGLALKTLLSVVPDETQAAAADALVDVLEEHCSRAGHTPPHWLRLLRTNDTGDI